MLSSPQTNAAASAMTTTIRPTTRTSIPALLLTASFIVLSCLSRTINAFTVDHQLTGTPVVSHSGPTNSLYGHEQLVDGGDHGRNKRATAFFNPGWNNGGFNNNNNNGWGGLLWASEPPNEYLKLWLVSEHNAYRKMVGKPLF
uniref:Uncharacterized protein n=1 Tax=Ditylenchus dipsaci TaxID=166011 RepID=A0A915CRL9_9BILA